MNGTHRHTAGKRRWGASRIILTASLALWGLSGCAPAPLSPPIRTGEPIGVQLMRAEPAFVGMPFRVLLDFEGPDDTAFITGGNARIDHDVAHTGGTSVQITPAAAKPFTVKLGSILTSEGFPGTWTLAGGYFISRGACSVTAIYEVDGKALLRRTVALEPRKWTPVLLDVTSLSDPNQPPPVGIGLLKFETTAEVWCDDVLVMDNSRELVAESGASSASEWTVRQRGFKTTIERQGGFRVTLPTPEAAGASGWRVEEADELRVRLVSGDGRHARTIYSDGREYVDAKLNTLTETPAATKAALAAEHASPAELEIQDELGRLERNTPGDQNNDGYNEAWGSYELKANGPRLELRIEPRTPQLIKPVLEITGLPKGKVLVNVEGQVVERSIRLPDGRVLIEIPGVISRAVTVTIGVR